MALESMGKYVDLEPLGRGGMAEVYRARDPGLDRPVAIKVILPHLAADEGFDERFHREARLVAALRHPNIVQIYEFDVQENQPYMVMEYLDGGTLQDRLADQRARGELMSLNETLKILEPLASALDFAHAQGAVHRDIKPANIMFSTRGDPVIVDFGIAKMLDESMQLTATGGVIGSPPYMSPEQASSKPIDKYSDIYSLGIVLYEMLAGRVPFQGDSITGVLMQHLNEQPPTLQQFNPRLPASVGDSILKALNKDPADRYASAGEMVTAVKDALSSEEAAAVSLDAKTMLEESKQHEALTATNLRRPENSLLEEPETPDAPAATNLPKPETALPEWYPESSDGSAAAALASPEAKVRSGRIFGLPIWLLGGIALLVTCGGGYLIFSGLTNSNPPEATEPAVIVLETTPTSPENELELPTATYTQAIIARTVFPMVTPYPEPYVVITNITVTDGVYIVEYVTFGYTEVLPGMHVHFFFDTVAPENAGAPGSGPWYVWGGPRPFNGYTMTDRPGSATQICALVANTDHSIILDTGNCLSSPDA